MREPITTPEAPLPKGPYSQGIVTAGRQLWVAGQLPIDPATGALAGEDIESQAEQVFKNVRAIAEAAGGSLASAVKVQVYLNDNQDFARMNEVYRRYFPEPRPARTTIQSNLRGILIEVDAVIALE